MEINGTENALLVRRDTWLTVLLLAEQRVQKKRDADSVIFSASGHTDINGNWYCQPVEAIRYSNVGSSGSYDRITQMNSDGICASLPNNFAGSLAPFDEEVRPGPDKSIEWLHSGRLTIFFSQFSVHFRGPLHLKQFAAYAPSESSKQKRRAPGMQGRGHSHRHQHMHNRPLKKEEGHEEKREMVSLLKIASSARRLNPWILLIPACCTADWPEQSGADPFS